MFVPEEQMSVEIGKGERFKHDADKWIEANPEAWEFMKKSAQDSADSNRMFGVKSLCEHVRWHMYAEGHDGFKLNNNYSAAFARRLIEEVPDCAQYLRTRSSVMDL